MSAAAAGACVVIAELQVKSLRKSEFVALARDFADECLAREPGCRQFQVVLIETTPNHVLFFEVYDDADAFETHRASPHLTRFKAAFDGMVQAEMPLRYGLAC